MSEEIEALKLFNEKAEELEKLSFVEKIKESKMSYKFHRDIGTLITISLPDEESIRAFVLTFRFFIQDNEKIPFRNMSKAYASPTILDIRKKQFDTLRNILLNPYLDAESSIIHKGKHITNREILYTYVYGYLSHSNDKLKAVYEIWSADDIGKSAFDFEFVNILSKVLMVIRYTKDLNEKALKELSNSS